MPGPPYRKFATSWSGAGFWRSDAPFAGFTRFLTAVDTASLREGFEETLTVFKLNLSSPLTRSLATTNAIENLMGSIRTVTHNIKRWRNKNAMVKRWVALAISTAQRKFRRLKGHQDMPALVKALRPTPVDSKTVAA